MDQKNLMFDYVRTTLLPGQRLASGISIIGYAGYEFKVYNRTTRNPSREKIHYWNCLCPLCNRSFITSENALLHSNIKSCGCGRIEAIKNTYAFGQVQLSNRSGTDSSSYKHGDSHTTLHNMWISMKDRCNNSNNKRYHCYGGRGIKVCDEWSGDNGYINFKNWAIANGWKEELHHKLSLDRINVNGNYEPSNCFFAGKNGNNCNIQQGNNRTNNNNVIWNGVEYTITELARHFGLDPNRIFYRMGTGKSLEEAVLAPAFSSGRKGSIERDAYIAEHGEFKQKENVVVPIYFTDYPDMNPNDPKLAYYTRDELAKIRGYKKHENNE